MAEPRDGDVQIHELRERLREMIDASSDPYLVEEQKRILARLLERFFSNLRYVMLQDEEEFDLTLSVVVEWVTDTYYELLEEYPDRRGRSGLAS